MKRWQSPLLLALLAALFFNQLAFTNLILARGDTFLYFYPYWHAAQDGLLNGRVPLWNPDIFMGAPLLANSQMGFFYPLNWPLWALLPVPYAVSATIVWHSWIAALGTYALGRRLGLGREAAVLAAVLFALGGYLTAQVEHVNQLQGLAWLPWVLWGLQNGERGLRNETEPRLSPFTIHLSPFTSLFFALQLLAGHTQTVFITGVAAVLTLFILPQPPTRSKPPLPITNYQLPIAPLLTLLTAALLALLISAVQLLPTLELTRYSSRAGGLTTNEVLSFSWPPLLASQSLLPSYTGHTFSEYVAFVPITALLLAVVGAWQWRHSPLARLGCVLSGLGLWLALGRFGGLYLLLAHLPGFNLFRVPARWLVLYALGVALLAGYGWQMIRTSSPSEVYRLRRPLVLAVCAVLALVLGGYTAVPLGRFLPLPPEAPLGWPNPWDTAAQLAELAFALFLISRPRPITNYQLPITNYQLPITLLLLFLATRPLPANHPTTPEAYFDQRPPSLRLHTLTADQTPPARFLSLSQTFFDPGDQAEIDTIYDGRLSPRARYDYTVAIKQKEILAPNLSMVYGQPSLDGFDGGVLPLKSYSDLMAHTLLHGEVTTDGRLREFLPALPPADVLDWFNVRYLITDKVGDAWVNGVYFDLQHPAQLQAGQAISVGYVPPFTATHLLVHAPTAEGTLHHTPFQPWADGVWAAELPAPSQPVSLTLRATRPWAIHGLTLFNAAEATFQPLVLGQYRLIHSGDVKIYENMDVAPRLYAVNDVDCPTGECLAQPPLFHSYTAEALTLGPISLTSDAWLVLTDAYYPGWQATLDGQPVPIVPRDEGFFRAVYVPAGEYETLTFTFRPFSYRLGRWLSLVGLLLWGGGFWWGKGGREG